MTDHREVSLLYVLVVVVAAIAAAFAHHRAECAGREPTARHRAAVHGHHATEEYSPSAHCGLGSGLEDITVH